MSNAEDWKKQIEQAVSNPVQVGEDNVFLKTIREFVATLDQSPFMCAQLRESKESKVHSIFIRPKYRRDIEVVLLSFWVSPYKVSVFGTGAIANDEELREFFVRFVRESQFPNTVAQFGQISNEDVSGTLWEKRGVWGPHDASVIVSAADQRRLAEAAEQRPGSTFDAQVTLDTKNPLNKFSNAREYRYLESGGYGLQIDSLIRVNGKDILVIKGTVLDTKLSEAA